MNNSNIKKTGRMRLLKRVLLSAACFIAFTCACDAQDVIVTKDSKRINAKVTEVNVDNVRYKNFDNQDGPVYTLLKSDIDFIVYQNGRVETFKKESLKISEPAKASSGEYYSCLQKNEYDILNEMKVNNRFLYQRYSSGMSMRSGAVTLILFGILGTGGGIVTLVNDAKEAEKNNEDLLWRGPIITIAGLVFVSAGIPISIVGKAKKNNALKNYCQQSYSLQATSPHFQMNVYPNRVGIAYVF